MTAGRIPMIRCVGGVVHDPAGRLLLIRRAHDPGKGRWSLPGGRVEPGESDSAALVREMAEETGLVVTTGRLVGSIERLSLTGVLQIFDYACTIVGGTLRAGDDADDAAWVDTARFYTLERQEALTEDLAETLRSWNALPRV
jgi:8-oxo-dGTP diphosphatase